MQNVILNVVNDTTGISYMVHMFTFYFLSDKSTRKKNKERVEKRREDEKKGNDVDEADDNMVVGSGTGASLMKVMTERPKP